MTGDTFSRPRAALLGLALALGAAQAQTAAPPTQSPPAQSLPATATPAPAALTLDAALALLAEAPSVRGAQLGVQVAQANLNAARTALGLTVSVSGNAGYSGASTATVADGTSVSTGSSLNGAASVNVSLGVLPWSSNASGLQSAQRSLTLAQARLNETQNAARLNVAQQYLAAVVAGRDAALATQTLALRSRALQVAQAQQQTGNATAQSVLSAQAALEAAQAAQVQAQAALDAARLNLGAALGRTLGDVSFVSPPSETFSLPDLEALVTRARASRREVIAAQNDVAAAQEALETLRRDQTLPDLTASVRYGPAGSGGLSTSLNLKQGTLGAGYTLPLSGESSSANRVVASVSGSYVVYSPAARAQLSAAQATVTQTQLTLSVTQQEVELDVRQRYAAVQTGLLGLQSQATQAQLAQSALEAARARLGAGTGTADEVAAAELTLAQAQRDLLDARATVQTSLIQLQNAAGGPA
ncbi:TolC family protein [Deinococcus hohokamensis]|uniref:TolC family protein n=1 Tax=Deinococcus hohokamensis TaxID=309883 RepID=A0ABV9IAV0_9DEIO